MSGQPLGGRAVLKLPTARPGGVPVEILESKLHRPSIRPGVVARPRLLARRRAAGTVPTVVVHASAGYGETTLLALWAEAHDRPVAWLSLDPRDNDPLVLLAHVAVALDRVSPLPAEVFDALPSAGASVPRRTVPRLGGALPEVPRPVVLALDEVRGATQIALSGPSVPVPIARQRSRSDGRHRCRRTRAVREGDRCLPTTTT